MLIRTRFSPSPTGMIHLGNVRAAFFSALFAKKNQGHFILRIEDTDIARSEKRYAEQLQVDIKWLGLQWQEGPGVEGPNGPYWQSQRHEIYATYYAELEEKKQAYPCFCTDQELALNRKLQLSRGQPPRYPGTCRMLSKEAIAEKIAQGKKPALRFHIPLDQKIEFIDLVKGPQSFNSNDIGDFIIRRAEGTASFMFCNAIDDALMKVTHVLRGEDHLANTPRQLMILNTLNLHKPEYGHLSLIMNEEGGRLSKRLGSSSLHDLREQGFLPLAILNYLSRLGHTYDSHALMSFADLANAFDLARVSRSAARFDQNQLLHWQKEAVMQLSKDEIWPWLGDEIKTYVPHAAHDAFINLIQPNICFPVEANHWSKVLFASQLQFNQEQVKILQDSGQSFFETFFHALKKYQLDLKKILDEIKQTLNVSGKKLFLPVRVALTGQDHGPELAEIISILGYEKTQQRIEHVLTILQENHA